MAFPSKKELNKALKKVSKTEGTLALPANPTPLQRFRHDIQQKFMAYKLRHRITQKELAEMLGIDEAKVSKILRNRLHEFSTDRLISLYEKINPKLKLSVR